MGEHRCQCGCGQVIDLQAWHYRRSTSRFIHGHQNRRGHWRVLQLRQVGYLTVSDVAKALGIGTTTLWPARPIGLRETAIAYYDAMERLARQIMHIFAVALALPEDFFVDKIDRDISAIRLINYPDQEREPLPGQLRSGEHSDYGTLTILKIEDAPGGLQVRTRHSEWVDVHAIPGAFIVNIGDLMMHWTNDRWISTLHRVVNPPRDRALGSRRLSIVFFHQPNYDAVIECLPTCQGPGNPPKHPPVTSGDHRLRKFLATSVEPPRYAGEVTAG